MFPFFILLFLWSLREIKAILFWLYLWQLKEYHIGRFLAHFSTYKGKRLFLNRLLIFKIALFLYALFIYFAFPKLLPWQIYAIWILALAVFYFFESVKFILDAIKKRSKSPVLTKKTLFLIFASFIFSGLFAYLSFKKLNFYWFSFSLLSFDIFSSLIISGIVLFLQPFTALLRNQTLKKAREKIEGRRDLVVIGITGSYGKTSTKEFLTTILSQQYRVLKTKEHQNSEVGISRCILNELKPEHQIFVCEMGAYNQGGIRLLCSIAQPKIGILTGINEQHLSTFGSQEKIMRAKYELIESLPDDGLAIFNGFNVFCRELYQKTEIPRKICGINYKSDIWAEDLNIEKELISFKVVTKEGERADFNINLVGGQNLESVLLAVCCARELGINLNDIAKACQNITPEHGAMKLLRGKQGLNIVNSTYSTNPAGVISHLDYLKIWHDKKIIVMPCLIELGKASKEIHQRVGRKIGEICDLAIITTKDRFKELKKGFLESGKEEKNILFLEDPEKIIKELRAFCHAGDVILFEGRVSIQLINSLADNYNESI